MKGMDTVLANRLKKAGVKEEDLQESFTHAGGHGGQNVNKVATCVVLVHLPSRIRIRCEDARTQGINRVQARRRLVEKLEAKKKEAAKKKKQLAEKKKRQKRRPSKAARARNVDNKRRKGETKRGRGKVKDF